MSSYLEYSVAHTPRGAAKLLYVNWPLVLLVLAVGGVGFVMLFSVGGGSLETWVAPQFKRFAAALALMFAIALVPIRFWRHQALPAYVLSLALLVGVANFGVIGMGAQRWIDIGSVRLQPSELTKITTVLLLAAYYAWLDPDKVSRPFWVVLPVVIVLTPTALVLQQPDLGTALLLVAGGGTIMFLAGVHWGYFAFVIASSGATVAAALRSKGTPWQILEDYQYRRIEAFLNPESDPLGAGYHVTQSKIALGSGGWAGRGFMQGTQSQLNFLPEKHTDFIFTTLAEEFGFLGGLFLLALYALIVLSCTVSGLGNRTRFGSLLILGVTTTFFLFFSLNMAMVMGLAPVVGVPLPLVSYGGSSMLALMIGFGLVQSAHIHHPRRRS